MAATSEYESLTVPLIADEGQERLRCKLGDVESNYNHISKGTTSSFKTIINGLNALSGYISFHI